MELVALDLINFLMKKFIDLPEKSRLLFHLTHPTHQVTQHTAVLSPPQCVTELMQGVGVLSAIKSPLAFH